MTLPEQATRTTVAEMWRAVLDGSLSQDDAHTWAARWIEADDPQIDDLMVLSALQRLHGFDLVWTNEEKTTVRHGGSAAYVHSASDISQAFIQWLDDCRSHDTDPAGYLERKRAAAQRDR
ncbi:hypothetical protein [Lentzea sp. NPDC051838]|uniref:hypothetical protein n=1 Tax=Lentzea sp. NPDC051838 TaxID=3154849 RepID=UPI00342DF771